ncbi:hypothetical protein AAL_08444 [Moelleriella libera RCEF 2490]|uniref:Transcription factor domain-containing protein n=1 Tax=Moelleriella libera RCEF 2490 TaxID=1081109 RepID=A0A167V6J3_9HYPO|nr:hypothetical protein AAL_08444 [Moelleriella libera RCEF 2490]
MELEWELPFSSLLWESNTSLEWVENLSQEPRIAGILQPNGLFNAECAPMQSLTLATQALMTDLPGATLLTSLASSPITSLFILTNIHSLVRDFTRCYYQLPPGLSYPSAFHICTQSQNRQIHAALIKISGLASERSHSYSSPDAFIWTSIGRVALSIKIAMCHPNQLLIGGMVDCSVVAGLATATYMELGLRSGARRSLYSILGNPSVEDASFVMLNDLLNVLSSICSGNSESVRSEAPWITVATYELLLSIWRSFTWAIAQKRADHES